MATKKAVKKAAKKAPVKRGVKKVAAKKVAKQVLEIPKEFPNEAYFVATVKGQRVVGQVYSHEAEYGDIWFYNQQGVGNCGDEHIEGYGTSIHIGFDEDADGNLLENLKLAGFTELRIVKDQRMIKTIESMKIPNFDKQWTVTIEDDGTASFGCGAVELTLEQIKAFIKVQEIINEDNEYEDIVNTISNHIAPENVNLDEAKELVARVERILADRKKK